MTLDEHAGIATPPPQWNDEMPAIRRTDKKGRVRAKYFCQYTNKKEKTHTR